MTEPQLPRPGNAATTSAMGHALHALTALLPALGTGEHELALSAERTDGTEMNADLTVSIEPGTCRVESSAEQYVRFFVLLTFALENSTVADAVLIATIATNTGQRACGWDIRDGWLHPINPADLREALSPLPQDDAAPFSVCHAPTLHRPH
ncbi:hypothetical protein [Streptomyces sp. NPDC057280]|uniref:hypothetical protein n=1 Tax=Streptomyces sp. NPDC057280 TaxID=3346081 RepID=UPI00362AE7BB